MGVATPVCVYTALICYSLLAEASLQASLIPNRTIIAGESFRLRCTVSTEGYTMKLVWNGKTVGQTTNRYLEKFVASAEETDLHASLNVVTVLQVQASSLVLKVLLYKLGRFVAFVA